LLDWYLKIIAGAKLRPSPEKCERHHIIPRSMGGDNTKDNLVDLTPREHFVCHYILTKITSGQASSKMACAFVLLRGATGTSKFSRQYERARLLVAESTSARFKGKVKIIDVNGVIQSVPQGEAEVLVSTGNYRYASKTNHPDEMVWFTNYDQSCVRKFPKRQAPSLTEWTQTFDQRIATKPAYMVNADMCRKTTQAKVQEYEQDGWIEVKDQSAIRRALNQIRNAKCH